jgi:mannosylglycerate hydrolase
MPKSRLNVVFHTHWDREWYFSFETYRYRLIHVIRRIIEALEQNRSTLFCIRWTNFANIRFFRGS